MAKSRVDSSIAPFRVSLEDQPFPEILVEAAGSGAPVVVESVSSSKLVRIRLQGQSIRMVSSSDSADTLRERLHRGGTIDRVVRDRCAARSIEGGGDEWATLLEEGLDPLFLSREHEILIRELVAEVFAWVKGDVFVKPDSLGDIDEARGSFPIADAIRLGVNKIADARGLVSKMGGKTALVRQGELLMVLPLSNDEEQLIDRVSSEITLFELVRTPPLTRADNARVLYGLFVMKAVNIKAPKKIKVQLRRSQ